MKVERDEKLENPTDEQTLLELTVCYRNISPLTYLLLYFIE